MGSFLILCQPVEAKSGHSRLLSHLPQPPNFCLNGQKLKAFLITSSLILSTPSEEWELLRHCHHSPAPPLPTRSIERIQTGHLQQSVEDRIGLVWVFLAFGFFVFFGFFCFVFVLFSNIFICKWMLVWTCHACVEVRGQRTACRCRFSPSQLWVPGVELGSSTWHQAPLPAELSHHERWT